MFGKTKDKDLSREPQIDHIKEVCNERENWFLARSNPCFEVWLYYHSFSEKPDFKDLEKCSLWKQHVNDLFQGGFDSRRHPIYIETASINAIRNFELIENKPGLGCTEVYKLANTIIPLIKVKLEKVLRQIEEK